MKATPHKPYNVRRPWGFETLVQVVDDDGVIHELAYTVDQEADEKSISAWAITEVERRNALAASAPEPEMTYTESEIEALLREKGYLDEDDKLDDLPPKETPKEVG